MLLLQAQQQQQAQARFGQQPKPSTFEQIANYAQKAKGAYDDVNNLYSAGTGLYSQLFGPTYSPATQALWNQAAGQASQAAWNAGADAATRAAGEQVASDAASQGLGNVLGGLAGAYMAYKGGDTVLNANKIGGVKGRQAGGFGGLQAGLGAGLAINALGLALGPIGWAALLGGSLLGGGLLGSRLGDKDMWKTEGKRLGKLLDRGIIIPEQLQGARWLGQGRKTKDLINPYLPKDFVGETPQYGWVNNKFATSRNSADLTGKDIWGYSAFFDKFGNDWLQKMSPAQREAIANKALERKAVNEHHGTIDINWNPQLESDVNQILGRAPAAPTGIAPKAPAPLPPSVVGVTPIPAPGKTLRKGFLNKLLPTG